MYRCIWNCVVLYLLLYTMHYMRTTYRPFESNKTRWMGFKIKYLKTCSTFLPISNWKGVSDEHRIELHCLMKIVYSIFVSAKHPTEISWKPWTFFHEFNDYLVENVDLNCIHMSILKFQFTILFFCWFFLAEFINIFTFEINNTQ